MHFDGSFRSPQGVRDLLVRLAANQQRKDVALTRRKPGDERTQSGAPIVLLAEHQATGGYPVIATVISADIGLVAQRLPGERLRFVRVDRDRAVGALRDARATFEAIA